MRRILKTIIGIVAVIAFFSLEIMLLNYLIVNDYSSYTRLMMHEFYNQEDIEVLFVGASHCYRGVNPILLTEATGKKVFNASSSSQAPDASFAIIKEAIKQYHVETVFLEISASMAQGIGNYEDRTTMASTYLISDYMRSSINKASFLLNASRSDYYVDGFFKARRNWTDIFNFDYVRNVLRLKESANYKTYSYNCADNGDEWYKGLGFVESSVMIPESGYYSTEGNTPIDLDRISYDWKKSIREIISYCNKHGVRIVLYDSPISNFQLASYGNYDDYVNYVSDFLSDQNAYFLEFNLMSDDSLPYLESNYKDGHHLNINGADAFSKQLIGIIDGKTLEAAFCHSVKEKLEKSPPRFYGVSYIDKESGRTIRMISNHPELYEFKVTVLDTSGNEYLLQNYDANNELNITNDLIESNRLVLDRLIVTYRPIGSKTEGTCVKY